MVNDSCSAVSLPYGVQVELYSDAEFTGDYETYFGPFYTDSTL